MSWALAGCSPLLLLMVVLLATFSQVNSFNVGPGGTFCNLDPSKGEINDPCGSLYDGVCGGRYCKCPPNMHEDPGLKNCVPDVVLQSTERPYAPTVLAPNNASPQESIVIYLTGDVDIIGCEDSEEESMKCPESEGYYSASNSSQCFRLYSGTYHNWEDAKAWCESEGMVLAKPEEHIHQELSRYLFDIQCPKYPCEIHPVWVGARGSDSYVMVWDRDNSEMGKSTPPCCDCEPEDRLHSIRCLGFCSGKPGFSQPYINMACDDEKRVTLCEVIDK